MRRMKADDAAELLDRDRGFAAGGQDHVRPGEAERRAVGDSGQRGGVPGAARRAQGAGRRQGHGEESARVRHPQGRRPGAARRQFLEERFGKWGLALAGKSRGLDAGGWFDTEIGEDAGPKSISHEHTFGEDTADAAQIESTLARLCEMVGRRLREHGLHARTIQLKLRYSDFTTITRAHSIARGRRSSTPRFTTRFASCSGGTGRPGRPCGCSACMRRGWGDGDEQMDLLGEDEARALARALAAADRMRDKFGESAVGLASGMRGHVPRAHARESRGPAGEESAREEVATRALIRRGRSRPPVEPAAAPPSERPPLTAPRRPRGSRYRAGRRRRAATSRAAARQT